MDEIDTLFETISEIDGHYSSLEIQEELGIVLTDMDREEIIAENNALKSEIESLSVGVYMEQPRNWSKILESLQDKLSESEYMILDMAISSPSYSKLYCIALNSGVVYYMKRMNFLMRRISCLEE